MSFLLFFPLWNLLTLRKFSGFANMKNVVVVYNLKTLEASQMLSYLWLPSFWVFLYHSWNHTDTTSLWWLFSQSFNIFLISFIFTYIGALWIYVKWFSRQFILFIFIFTSLLIQGNLPDVNRAGMWYFCA